MLNITNLINRACSIFFMIVSFKTPSKSRYSKQINRLK